MTFCFLRLSKVRIFPRTAVQKTKTLLSGVPYVAKYSSRGNEFDHEE
jgi:hypothetical protein